MIKLTLKEIDAFIQMGLAAGRDALAIWRDIKAAEEKRHGPNDFINLGALRARTMARGLRL